MAELFSIIMSAVGKLLKRKEKKAAAGDNNKKSGEKLMNKEAFGEGDGIIGIIEKLKKDAADYYHNNINKKDDDDDDDEGGDIKIHKTEAHAILEELVEKRKKKTDDPPLGDERNHIKAMRSLKEMHEKVKKLAQEQEKQGGGITILILGKVMNSYYFVF